MGTDAGVGAHGGNLRELALMVECGMTPMQAIEASTRVPAELLGWSSRVGTLQLGKFADVIAVSGDPLGGIALLSSPENVRVVMKQGEVVRALDQGTRVPVAAGHADG
jgi:imidazolonepropionase-like amidohydrolase